MKLAAAEAIAAVAQSDGLSEEYVIPQAFDMRIAPAVASAAAEAAIRTGVARRKDITPEMVREKTIMMLARLNDR